MITYNDVVAATPNVLKRLKEYASLPEHGTVAGQAVASLFYEELNIGVLGPINDIDIFVSLNLPPEQRGVVHTGNPTRVRNNPTSVNVTGMQADMDGYSRIKFICARNNVTIFRTYQDGVRNFTLIKHNEIGDGGEQTLDVSQDVIRGFDLNLVGVGIHLDSQTPVVTPEFLDFLNRKTIEVVTCNTPTHTLIRLAKKVYSGEIVGAHCDYDHQRGMLETYLGLVHRESNTLINYAGTVLKVGEKYRKVANTYAQYLPPLKADQHNRGLYAFNPQSLRVEEVVDPIQQLMNTNVLTGQRINFLLSYTFVANFPRVYQLATQSNTQPWEMLSQAWDPANQMNDALRLNNVSAALWGRPIIDPELGLDDVEAATFVFNNTLDKAHYTHAVQSYQKLSASEKIIFHDKFDHIKHILDFIENKNDYIEGFIVANGLRGLTDIAKKISKEEVHELVDKMFELLSHNEQLKGFVTKQLYSEHFVTHSPNLFQHYEDKAALFEKLLNVGLDDIDRLDCTKKHVLALAYCNDLWRFAWDDIAQPSYACDRFLNQGQWLFEQAFDNGWGERPHHVAFIKRVLDRVDDEQIFENNSRLLCNIFVPQHYEIIRDRLLQVNRSRALSEVSNLFAHLTDVGASEDYTALCSKLVLDLNTVDLGATKSKRKM